MNANLIPFKKNDPRTRELARLGGRVRSSEKRVQAMLSRARRQNAVAYAQYADISPAAAIALLKVFLDRGRYRDFLANEMFELLGATNGYFEQAMVYSTWRDQEGKIRVNHSSKERAEAIKLKMKALELLLKAGKAFFPEMREVGQYQAVQVNVGCQEAEIKPCSKAP